MIKEFDLDAPTQRKPERLRFRSETRCVSALFERCYRPSRATGEQRKVLVEVVPIISRKDVVELLGVLTVQINGDPLELMSMTSRAKMEQSLEFLMEGIERIAASEEWNVAPFHTAAADVRRRDFKNEWTWNAPLKSASRELSAEVIVQHRIEQADISVRFSDSKGNILQTAHLISDEPNEFIFYENLGTLRWLDESTVELVSRDGQRRLTAALT